MRSLSKCCDAVLAYNVHYTIMKAEPECKEDPRQKWCELGPNWPKFLKVCKCLQSKARLLRQSATHHIHANPAQQLRQPERSKRWGPWAYFRIYEVSARPTSHLSLGVSCQKEGALPSYDTEKTSVEPALALDRHKQPQRELRRESRRYLQYQETKSKQKANCSNTCGLSWFSEPKPAGLHWFIYIYIYPVQAEEGTCRKLWPLKWLPIVVENTYQDKRRLTSDVREAFSVVWQHISISFCSMTTLNVVLHFHLEEAKTRRFTSLLARMIVEAKATRPNLAIPIAQPALIYADSVDSRSSGLLFIS